MPRNRFDLHVDTVNLESGPIRNSEEIWIDGPLSSAQPPTEIWIDGPPEFYSSSPKVLRRQVCTKPRSHSHRQPSSKGKPSTERSPILPMKTLLSPFLSSTVLDQSIEESKPTAAFDTESIVSSHCHLPVLPVFKDHSLLPFRPLQTLPRPKKLFTSKLDLRSSTNQLNDDMERLEKTLETLLVPSPIAAQPISDQSMMTKSLNRIDQLSSLMSNDEKSKRLSRIVSPTRFDRLFA